MDTFFDLHGKITATGYYGTTFECASGINTEEAQENMHCNIFFIFCLSISDVMVGATGQVFHALWLATSIASGNLLRNAFTNCFLTLLNYFFQTSSQLVFIIAIDRYIHMKYLGKYNTIITQTRARLIIFLISSLASQPSFQLMQEQKISLHRTYLALLYSWLLVEFCYSSCI